MPQCFTPFSFSSRIPSNICSVVKPYFASPGLSMIAVLIVKLPPGLYRTLTVPGSLPMACSQYSMWEISSKLMMAPILAAYWNSDAGVTFDVNMILSPGSSIAFAKESSALDAQSQPKPYSFRMPMTDGFGQALTAKNSR